MQVGPRYGNTRMRLILTEQKLRCAFGYRVRASTWIVVAFDMQAEEARTWESALMKQEEPKYLFSSQYRIQQTTLSILPFVQQHTRRSRCQYEAIATASSCYYPQPPASRPAC